MRPVLPIDALLPDIIESLRRTRNLVIEAPPGAGKTTRVPPALLGSFSGEVLVLEPRRIAARMAARRVAFEMGERVGETVGYQVRFEDVSGPGTRLRFLTEGVLTRRLLNDPQLRAVSAVVLDEFHERHLEGDLALALLRRLQLGARPELRIVIMSATLNAAPLAAYLDGCPVLRSEGRLFEVRVSYRGYSAAPLEEQVASAVEDLGAPDGDVLVFLPGAAEIRRAARAVRPGGRRVAMLHGDLPAEEQDAAVQPGDTPKLILSTNVAESSITIEGVTAVIDSGLARVASDSPSTGLPTLQVKRISRASATQRAGRAGRVRPGLAIRLYSQEDFARRPAEDTPEILRRELSQAVLELEALGARDVPWFEAPPVEAVAAARELLVRLGAERHAREMARLPLHPRLARMLIEARHVECCRAAAILSSGDRYDDTNLLHLLDRELSPRAQQIEQQIRRVVRPRRGALPEQDLLRAVLTGFPDRVARRRNEREVQLAHGRPAALADAPEFLVALDVEERSDQPLPLVRLAAPIKADWLLDFYPERIRERNELVWNRVAERVEVTNAMLYDEIAIDESRGAPGGEAAGRMLAERAIEAGLHRFADPEEVEALLARVAFAAEHGNVRRLGPDDVRETLAQLASGLASFSELRAVTQDGGLIRALKARVDERKLEEVAPERIRIGPRRLATVHYPLGQQPWVASRLQDFFGQRETPRVARGAVPLVVKLLAPNNRPVQTTTDLAGFWERLYPQVRRELSRRYPKHPWPEDPMGVG